MFSLAVDYFLLAFISSIGALQITAALSGLKGLYLLPYRRATYAVGAALLVGAFAWFVLTGDTYIPGDTGGVEGAQQFTYFLLAVAAAGLTTAFTASLTQPHAVAPPQGVDGIEALRHTTLLGFYKARFGKRKPHA